MERCRCRACGQTLYETIRLDGALTANAFPATPQRDDDQGAFFQCPGCGARIDLVTASDQAGALMPRAGVMFDRVEASPVMPPWRKPPMAAREDRAPGMASPPRPEGPPSEPILLAPRPDGPLPEPILLPLLWHPSPADVPLDSARVATDVRREKARALESWLYVCREQLRAGRLDAFVASLKVGVEMLAALQAEPGPPEARAAAEPSRLPPERAERRRWRGRRGRGAA
jgi:hypothetical protein